MRIALVGYGSWGRRVARAIARVGDLVIVEPSVEQRVQAEQDWKGWDVPVVPDLGALAVHPATDAAWIATPVDKHYRVAEDALRYGMHVLVEKPFVTDAAHARDLVSLSSLRHRLVMAGHLSLYTRDFRSLVDAADGDVRAISTTRWNTDPSLSDHSALLGIGPHDVAMAVRLWGRPDRVEWARATRHRASARLVWDTTEKTPHREWTLTLDWLATVRRRAIDVTDGRGRPWIPVLDTLDGTGEHHDRSTEPLLAEALDFVYAIADTTRWPSLAQEALDVSLTIAAIEQASRAPADGPTVSVDVVPHHRTIPVCAK